MFAEQLGDQLFFLFFKFGLGQLEQFAFGER